MAGANAILNSSLEFGDNWLHAVSGALPDSWLKAESVVGAGLITPRIDYRNPQHGIASARIQDKQLLAQFQTIYLYQENVAVMAGVGSPNVMSMYVEGYTGQLDLELVIGYHTAAHALVSSHIATWTNAQLLALGSASGPVRIWVTGNVPATTHHVTVNMRLVKNTAGSTTAIDQADITVDRFQYESGSVPSVYAPADGYQGGGGGAGPKDVPFVYNSGEYLLSAASPLLGVKLNDHNPNSGVAYDLIVEKVEGLYSLPDIKVLGDYEDNAYHGGFAGVEHISSRVITMDLILRAESEYAYNKRLSAIKKSLIPDSTDRKLWFKRVGMDGLSKKFINVRLRRLGGFDSTYDSAKGYGRGSLQLVAYDPAMYDAISIKSTAAPGAGVTGPINFAAFAGVPGPGSFRTYPVVTITGPVTNPHVYRYYTGTLAAEENYVGDFILATTIPAGQSVTIDFKNRTVIHSSGADWRQYIDDASVWWAVSPMPGANVFVGVWANPNVTGFSADIEWWTAWL